MSNKWNVLDHGYVARVESWGSEERIIEAARMSTGRGFRGWGELRCSCGARSSTARFTSGRLFVDDGKTTCTTERGGAHVAIDGVEAGDERLLRYLWDHKHATPFEMAGLTVEVQAPIFVFREWHRHRTQSYNELSARYTPLPDLNYVPSVDRLLMGGSHTKQAAAIEGAEDLDAAGAERIRQAIALMYASQQALYEQMLKAGVSKELARVHLPVGRYSRMRASANIRNWFAFLTLRMAPNAQWEIRQYANAVGGLIAETFPLSWKLFTS